MPTWGMQCPRVAAASPLAPLSTTCPPGSRWLWSAVRRWSRGFWGHFPKPVPFKAAACVVASWGGGWGRFWRELLSRATGWVGFPTFYHRNVQTWTMACKDRPASHPYAHRLDPAANALLFERAFQKLKLTCLNFLGWPVPTHRVRGDEGWGAPGSPGLPEDSPCLQWSPGRWGAPQGTPEPEGFRLTL